MCADNLRTGRYSTGARLVAEAVYRRLITPRGMLRGGDEEANYGLDLAALVGTASTPALLASLPARIKNEVLKDERLRDASVSVTSAVAGAATTWTIAVRGLTDAGPFVLRLAVSDVTTELLGLEAA